MVHPPENKTLIKKKPNNSNTVLRIEIKGKQGQHRQDYKVLK